jgi:hypothetical protein
MAFVDQGLKEKLAPAVKAVCKKYGVKGSLSVRHHSTLVLKIKSGSLDLVGNYNRIGIAKGPNQYGDPFEPRNYVSVNEYHYKDHFDGKALQFITEVLAAMQKGNWNNTDLMTDYFDVGWYVDVKIGEWNKPYELVS